MSEMIDLPKDVREIFEKFDEEINSLKNVCEGLKTYKRMIEFKRYD